MRLAALFLLAAAFAAGVQRAPRIEKAFDHYYNLEYDESIEIFRQVVAERPNDPEIHADLAQAILYRELFEVGALESELVSGTNSFLRRPKVEPSEADQREFEYSIARAIEITDRQLEEDGNNVEALYVQGVAHGLKSNYDFLVRKAWMDALKSATRSRKLHSKILDIDPDMIDARMIPAVHEYVVGSLPWYIRMISSLTGFSGDKEGGITTLEEIAERGDRNRHNARVLLSVLYRREKRPADAIPLLRKLIADFPRNYLMRMEMVQMYSDLGEKEKGLEVVREIERLKSAGAPGYDRMPEHKLWYTRGTLLFWYLDLDQALADFERMTTVEDDLTLHQAQLAWYRVGQTRDLLGRRDGALAAYRRVIEMAPNSERAKQAKRHLKKPCTIENRK